MIKVCPICKKEHNKSGLTCSKNCYKILWKKKVEESNLKKYGVKNVFQLESVKNKIKSSPGYQSKEAIEKGRQTRLKNGGIGFQRKDNLEKALSKLDHSYMIEENKKRWANLDYKEKVSLKISQTKQLRTPKQNRDSFLKGQEKLISTNLKKYGVPYVIQLPEVISKNGQRISNINKEFAKKLGIEYSDLKIGKDFEFNIDNYSYDIKYKNILIEINPTFTHNFIYSPFGIPNKDKNMHLNKTLLANKNNFDCIHIFDWDDENKIIDLILDKEKIYGRNCKIVIYKNDNKSLKEKIIKFLDDNHLQNSCLGMTYAVCLFYKEELVGVMTYGKPRYNKNYDWELLRLCFKRKMSIIGGTNKMWKYKPNGSIISYCDISKFNGKIYESLGFKLLRIQKPNIHWFRLKSSSFYGPKHITNNLLRLQGFDRLFNTNFGKNTSNIDLILEASYLPIYDCGQKIFIFN